MRSDCTMTTGPRAILAGLFSRGNRIPARAEAGRGDPEDVDLSRGPAGVIELVGSIRDAENRRLAVSKIEDAVGKLDSQGLVRLDETVRERSGCDSPWWDITPAAATTIARQSQRSTPVLGLLSLHPNGHVREQAVRELAMNSTGDELPFLALRANDWVSQVREAACGALHARVRIDYAEHLLRYLPLLVRLEHGVRYSQPDLVGKVAALLLEEGARPAFLSALKTLGVRERRACWTNAWRRPELFVDVADIALEDNDPAIRRSAARVLAASDEGTLVRYLDRLQSDVTSAVRATAAEAMGRRLGAKMATALERLALDTNATVRETARYYLKRVHPVDFVPLYFQHLGDAHPDIRRGAILGIAEVGGRDDARSLARFLASPSSRERRASLRAVARLDREGFAESIVRALSDPSPKVSAAARDALAGQPPLAREPLLAERFRDGTAPVHVRINALRLLGGGGKWRGLSYLIEAASADEATIREWAVKSVGRWLTGYNRSFVAPAPDELLRIDRALGSYGRSLAADGSFTALRDVVEEWKRSGARA
jgi:HEAT repeat protein